MLQWPSGIVTRIIKTSSGITSIHFGCDIANAQITKVKIRIKYIPIIMNLWDWNGPYKWSISLPMIHDYWDILYSYLYFCHDLAWILEVRFAAISESRLANSHSVVCIMHASHSLGVTEGTLGRHNRINSISAEIYIEIYITRSWHVWFPFSGVTEGISGG